MRDRVDRRFALLVGLLLTAWAMTNDLALSWSDLGFGAREPVGVAVASAATTLPPETGPTLLRPAPPTTAPAAPSAAGSPAAPSSG